MTHDHASRLHYTFTERAVARLHLQTGLARVLSYLVVVNSVVGRRRSTEHRGNEKAAHRFIVELRINDSHLPERASTTCATRGRAAGIWPFEIQ